MAAKTYFTAPRTLAMVGGYQVPMKSFDVTGNAFTAADTFVLDLPFQYGGKSSKDFILRNADNLASALVTDADVQVEIYAGQPSNPNKYGASDLYKIMNGFVDTFDFYGDDQEGSYVQLTGRNLAGPLLDTFITSKWPNNTSSQIANMAAIQFGLKPQITPTTTLAGSYYNQNATVMTNQTSWLDLLAFLADNEGFVLRIIDTALYFGPISGLSAYAAKPVPLTWQDNLEKFQLTRQPHAARDIEVQVITYDANHKNKITATAKSTTAYSPRLKNQLNRGSYIMSYAIPGLTRQQADSRAKQILSQLSKQQIVSQLTTSLEYGYDSYSPIAIGGLGAVLSHTGYVNSVERTFSVSQGYSVLVNTTNELLQPAGAA